MVADLESERYILEWRGLVNTFFSDFKRNRLSTRETQNQLLPVLYKSEIGPGTDDDFVLGLVL